MEKLIIDTKNIWQTFQNYNDDISSDEKFYKKFRRSIYATKTINKGEKITKDNIRIIRPGLGLEPKYYNKIFGKKAIKRIDVGVGLKLNLIS